MSPKSKSTLKSEAPVKFYRRIAFGFIALTGVLIILAAYFILSRAEIAIKVVEEPISADFMINIKESEAVNPESPEADGIVGDFATEEVSLSGKVIETTVSGGKEYKTSGKKVAQGEVGGKVTIFNNYGKDQPLVATTRLLSKEGILYRLKKNVTVPVGGRVEAEVYADNPTEEAGKLGPTRFTIPGLWEGLQEKIYAQSFEPMHGANQEIKFATEEDIKNGFDALNQVLTDQVMDNLKTQMKSGGEVLGKVIIKGIDEKKSSLKAGETGEKFSVNMALKVVGVAFSKKDFELLVKDQLQKIVPEDKELANIDYAGLTFVVEGYDLRAREANMMVHVEGKISMKTDNIIFDEDRFIGLDKERIMKYLEVYPEIESATVEFSPFWVKKVPHLKNNVKIIIQK
ncbi:MAG TPA: hypothetical protein VJB41_02775 [Patescibacteria group bacterium]|nr:hypothetical protein [Patescibacteria group bacterium]